MEKDIDIIIPTFNRALVLEERLPSYWNQPEARNIFIVDSGESQETEEMVERIRTKSPIPIFYYRFPKHEVQQICKNYGISQSKAPFIFIGEDDLELPLGHLAVLKEALLRKDADIVGGRRIYIRDGESQKDALEKAPKNGKIFKRLPFEAYFEEYFEGEIIVPYLHSNTLIRKEVLKTVKYDGRYKGNAFREELDFYLNCLAQGKTMIAISQTACFHLKSPRKMGSGSQIARLKYEYYVWINTVKCFWKNRAVLRSKLDIKSPVIFAFMSLFARYTNALWRRIKRKH